MIALTLYGKPSSMYQYLKMHVEEFTTKAGIDISINEVNETNDFIKESIGSIPAVKLDGEVKSIEQRNINAFINEVNHWIYSKENDYDLMKINVPIDFSDTANNAVNYALGLNKKLSGVLNLIHCYYPTPTALSAKDISSLQLEEISKQNLEQYRKQVSADSLTTNSVAVPIASEFIEGFPASKIVDISQRDTSGIIVIGSTGGGQFKKYFGSVSTEVVFKSECPVLVVPPKAKYKALKKIALCSNDLELDHATLDKVIQLAKPHDSELEIVHVDEGSDYDASPLINAIRNLFPTCKISFKLLKGDTKLRAINEYSKSIQPNLMVLSKKSESLISALFRKSLTKEILLTSTIPLLIVHG